MLILTAITPKPPYSDELVDWSACLTTHGYDFVVQELKNTGDWMGNCLQKPKTILDMYNEHNQDILWLDVDMRVRDKLSLIEDNIDNYDFMCYERTDCKMHNIGWHWNAGAVFFRQSPKGRATLEKWVEFSEESIASSHMPEQKALHYALHNINPKTLSLPETYNADWDKNLDGVVIEHLKVSRKYREIVNNGKEQSGVKHNVTIEEGKKLNDA